VNDPKTRKRLTWIAAVAGVMLCALLFISTFAPSGPSVADSPVLRPADTTSLTGNPGAASDQPPAGNANGFSLGGGELVSLAWRLGLVIIIIAVSIVGLRWWGRKAAVPAVTTASSASSTRSRSARPHDPPRRTRRARHRRRCHRPAAHPPQRALRRRSPPRPHRLFDNLRTAAQPVRRRAFPVHAPAAPSAPRAPVPRRSSASTRTDRRPYEPPWPPTQRSAPDESGDAPATP